MRYATDAVSGVGEITTRFLIAGISDALHDEMGWDLPEFDHFGRDCPSFVD